MRQAIETDSEFVTRMVGDFPTRWQHRLTGRWERQRSKFKPEDAGLCYPVHAQRSANLELLQVSGRLSDVRLPLDATDGAICAESDKLAERASEFARVYKTLPMVRAAMERVAVAYAVDPPDSDTEDAPALARMADPQWWRRKLRNVHAKRVEGAAIGLGYVNRNADPYISNESVWRRAQQNERNAASLEATIATNEDGQEYTLAELAATGPANKAIRRAELMTRIAGFERIADSLGHVGVFFTITCPSRMHKWATRKGGGVIENPKYDGTLPNDAQKHLAKTWARIRAALARRGIFQYGFRIAEPNHDGTPHWHVLVFLSPHYRGDRGRCAVRRLFALVRRYALGKGTDRTERGAKRHRCDFKPIDKGRGSAAGYIAKYVSKNIDGYRLDKDLIGNDAVETSHRVEAWASTWRIRQFQQVGGPPVGPWRELRRVESVPANAPAHLIAAHAAVNKTKSLDALSDSQQQVIKGAQWDAYVAAQGGPFCGRRYAIRVEKADLGAVGKYGEAIGPVPMGVSTLETATMPGSGLKYVRRLVVESARHVWIIAKKAMDFLGLTGEKNGRNRISMGGEFSGRKLGAVPGIYGREGGRGSGSGGVGGEVGEVGGDALNLKLGRGEASSPWTCVNNCTGGEHGSTEGGNGKRDMGGGPSVAKGPGTRKSDGRCIRGATFKSDSGYQFGT